MHRAPLAALAEFERYASAHGAAYDIDECFEAFAIREADKAKIPQSPTG
jgi:hypothetical protein